MSSEGCSTLPYHTDSASSSLPVRSTPPAGHGSVAAAAYGEVELASMAVVTLMLPAILAMLLGPIVIRVIRVIFPALAG